MICYHEWESAFGILTLAQQEDAVCELRFGADHETDWIPEKTELLTWAEQELAVYFAGKRKNFTFPYEARGTPFQKRVWEALTKIPYGEVRSYQEIARAVGNPKACRAVGMANHANPLPILVPCHRVIGKNGTLTGYGGGLDMKKRLLALEGWKGFL